MKTRDVICTQGQWADFIESSIWRDLRQFFLEELETNRDLLEGIVILSDEGDQPSDDQLRGACATFRHIMTFVEGWADGSIPIAFNIPEEETND